MSADIDTLDFLASTQLFAGVERATLESIAAYLQTEKTAEGDCLIREGDQDTHLYLIRKGEFQVSYRDEKGQEIKINRCGSGESVGEIALLTGEKRSATVYALEAATS